MRPNRLASLLLCAPLLIAVGCASDPSTVGPATPTGSSSPVSRTGSSSPTAAPSTPGASAPAGSTTASPTAGPGLPSISGTEIDIEVGRDGRPVGGVRSVTIPLGQTFTLVVTSAVADEVHLHGYDVHQQAAVGSTVSIVQNATIPGSVVAELEGSGTTLVRVSSS